MWEARFLGDALSPQSFVEAVAGSREMYECVDAEQDTEINFEVDYRQETSCAW